MTGVVASSLMKHILSTLLAVVALVLPVAAQTTPAPQEQMHNIYLLEDVDTRPGWNLFAIRNCDQFQYVVDGHVFNDDTWKLTYGSKTITGLSIEAGQKYAALVLDGPAEGLIAEVKDMSPGTETGVLQFQEVPMFPIEEEEWEKLVYGNRVAVFKMNTLSSAFGPDGVAANILPSQYIFLDSGATRIHVPRWDQKGYDTYFVNSNGEWKDATAPFGPSVPLAPIRAAEGLWVETPNEGRTIAPSSGIVHQYSFQRLLNEDSEVLVTAPVIWADFNYSLAARLVNPYTTLVEVLNIYTDDEINLGLNAFDVSDTMYLYHPDAQTGIDVNGTELAGVGQTKIHYLPNYTGNDVPMTYPLNLPPTGELTNATRANLGLYMFMRSTNAPGAPLSPRQRFLREHRRPLLPIIDDFWLNRK